VRLSYQIGVSLIKLKRFFKDETKFNYWVSVSIEVL